MEKRGWRQGDTKRRWVMSRCVLCTPLVLSLEFQSRPLPISPTSLRHFQPKPNFTANNTRCKAIPTSLMCRGCGAPTRRDASYAQQQSTAWHVSVLVVGVDWGVGCVGILCVLCCVFSFVCLARSACQTYTPSKQHHLQLDHLHVDACWWSSCRAIVLWCASQCGRVGSAIILYA